MSREELFEHLKNSQLDVEEHPSGWPVVNETSSEVFTLLVGLELHGSFRATLLGPCKFLVERLGTGLNPTDSTDYAIGYNAGRVAGYNAGYEDASK